MRHGAHLWNLYPQQQFLMDPQDEMPLSKRIKLAADYQKKVKKAALKKAKDADRRKEKAERVWAVLKATRDAKEQKMKKKKLKKEKSAKSASGKEEPRNYCICNGVSWNFKFYKSISISLSVFINLQRRRKTFSTKEAKGNKIVWIGWDNEQCPVQWFHLSGTGHCQLACSGTSRLPKGSWFRKYCKPVNNNN